MAKKGKGKGKKGGGKRRKFRKKVSAARQHMMRFAKGLCLAGPTLAYVAEGVMQTHGFVGKIQVAIARLGVATTGILVEGGGVRFLPQYLLIGWGPLAVYKGIQFGVNMIPGKRDSPFAEIGHVLGG